MIIGTQTLRRIFFRNFRDPVFIPTEGRGLLATLDREGARAFVQELERLSSLGSAWAACTRAFIALYPDARGQRDVTRALELSSGFAAKGDGYALYVLSWALLLGGDKEAGNKAMHASVAAGFAPAYVELMRAGWNSWRRGEGDPKLALGMFKYVRRSGHKGAWLAFCALARSGKAGGALRLLGQLLFPLASLHYMVALLRDPFSLQVLMFNDSSREPLFKGGT